MHPYLYAALAVVVPAVWGVLMYFVFGVLDKKAKKSGEGPPPVDYSI